MKNIPNFLGYAVTKNGEVWSYSKPRSSRNGMWLKPVKIKSGYSIVYLRKNNRTHHKYIHRLVLEAYVGPCPKAMEARHLDGNKQNNKLENLKWGTRSENRQDAVKHGTIIGENHSQNKLSESNVRMIIYTYQTGLFSQRKIADWYDIGQMTVSDIITRKTWKHI